ncbi:hypothetical protein ACQY0O_006430 [Thecaphora frezii]
MSDTASIQDEANTVTPATSLAGTAASMSGSPNPSNSDHSASKFKLDDALTADQLDSLYDDLPEDSTALKAIVGTMRLEMSKREHTIAQLREEIDEVKTSHSIILHRSAEWKDELELLRTRVPALEAELQQEKEARELEADRVKDLRLRAEESRRAIMRLQGDQGAARAKAKSDNRRSMGPGVLASWVPPGSSGGRDEQEDAELKRSKRASLAFGPNASLNVGGRPGHRRTASGSRSVSANSRIGDAADEPDEPTSPTLQQNANGLRGLRLSGTSLGPHGLSLHPPTASVDEANSNPGSRRSSMHSNGMRSPRLSGVEQLADGEGAQAAASTRLSVPSSAASIRNMLALTSPALSPAIASSNGCTSPILEDGEDGASRAQAAAASDLATALHSTSSDLQLEADLKAKDIEVERLNREMREMRNKMEEAIEARLASEACLKALREFIANHDAAADASEPSDQGGANGEQRSSVGAGLLRGVKLPPLPTDDIADDAADAGPSRRDSKQASIGGWSMKLPQLMRKNTSNTGSGSTPGQTPADETGSAFQGVHSSPKKSGSPFAGAGSGPSASTSIGGSLASLLTRNNSSTNSTSAALSDKQNGAAGSTNAADPADSKAATAGVEGTASPPVASNAFKGFGWFKKGSNAQGATGAEGAGSLPLEFEDKVMSPPFRSLDHDQVVIRRQSVALTPESVHARLGEESDDTAPKRPAEPEVSARAQKALEKTANVEMGGDFVPAAFD